MRQIFSRLKNDYGWLNIFLIACAICQTVITFYFNCFKAVSRMTIDSSVEYLKTIVIAQNGGFFPTDLLHETTQPLVERIFLLVAPLYRLTGNLWFSYAIANLIVTALSVYILIKICNHLKLKAWQMLIVVNLFLCPYLASGFNINNDLGYFICVNGFMAAQNMSELFFLLVVYVLIQEQLDKKNIAVGIITLVFGIYLCMCKGLGMLTWCGIPLIVFIIVLAWIKDDYRILVSWKAMFSYAVLASMIIGRIAGGAMGLEYVDGSYNWTDASNIFSNLGKIIEGFMLLIGAVPATGVERAAFSINGLPFVFGRVIFYVIIISIIAAIINLVRNNDRVGEVKYQTELLLVTVFISNIFEYSIIDTRLQGEGDIFCGRYLITALIGAFILVGLFLDEIKRSFFKICGVFMLFVSIACMDLFSDYYLSCANNDSFKVQEILSVVERENPGLIVFWSEYEELTPSEKVIRVLDYGRVYKNVTRKNHLNSFGDYSFYDDTTEYIGPTMIITSLDSPAAPKELLGKYELVDEIANIAFYYADSNYIDLKEWCEFE